MTDYLKRDSNTMPLATFWENFLLKKYNFEPPYQRRSVWNEEKQSFLIDTILRNYPMPPIFLHQHIDAKTGRVTYDVIDGKQRLTSIVRFIRNEIPVSTELDGVANDEAIAGKKFGDLDEPPLDEYKKVFWRYQIPVEYIDTNDSALVDNIFDRLNRNGEPLQGQELRNAKFHGSAFLVVVDKAAQNPVWEPRLKSLDVQRMGDKEFISELLFVLLEDGPCEGRSARLDELYDKYANLAEPEAVLGKFDGLSKALHDLGIEAISTLGVSHVYGLWTFVELAARRGEDTQKFRPRLAEFYERFQADDRTDQALVDYKNSVSWATRTRGQRTKRLNALCTFAGL